MRTTSITRLDGFLQSVKSISGWFESIGIIALAIIVLTALADVIGSKVFKFPVPGSTELTGILQIIAISGGLAISKINGRHIAVTFLPDKLRGRSKAGLDIFISVLGLGLFAVVVLTCFQYGVNLFHRGTGTFLLEIVYYPFAFWIALCCVPLCLLLLIDLLNAINRMMR